MQSMPVEQYYTAAEAQPCSVNVVFYTRRPVICVCVFMMGKRREAKGDGKQV